MVAVCGALLEVCGENVTSRKSSGRASPVFSISKRYVTSGEKKLRFNMHSIEIRRNSVDKQSKLRPQAGYQFFRRRLELRRGELDFQSGQQNSQKAGTLGS